jgi:catechol 2,3-dioxygenase-like lactoylglutathione lyase family enzyme
MGTPAPVVVGYRHAGIIAGDLEKSLHFYRDLLGLEVIQDFSDDSDYINEITGLRGANVHMVKLKAPDGMVLELLDYVTHPTGPVKMQVHNVGACHLAFRVGNIDAAYEQLSKNGVRFISKPVLSSEGIAKVCFCFDPNDIRIELVEMLSL